MEKIIVKYFPYILGILLLSVYFFGLRNMYFHQDDLDWFIMANKPLWQFFASPLSDHINYLFRILLKAQWEVFGFNFGPYLFVSLIIHSLNIYLLYRLIISTTKRRDLAVAAAILFVVNTNWTEIILWFSGQTISITLTFILIALNSLYQQKHRLVSMLMSTMTSALALPLLPASFVVWGKDSKGKLSRIGSFVLFLSLLVFLFYKYVATDGTSIEFSLTWLVQVGMVMVLGFASSVIGRLLFPFDSFEMSRVVVIMLACTYFVVSYRRKIMDMFGDQWNRFLGLFLFFYYLIVAVGRAQYGVGIMRAERYVYVGLAILLLLAASYAARSKIKVSWLLICMIVVMQSVSFYKRATNYFVRPNILKDLVEDIKTNGREYKDVDYLPHAVLNDERLKYKDLKILIEH